MSKCGSLDDVPSAVDWRSATPYKSLLHADRRAFAWEWLRRHIPYRLAWQRRDPPPSRFGLLAYEDPDRVTPDARPIWGPDADPRVIESWPKSRSPCASCRIDIRALAQFVTVEIDEYGTEHWLLTDGQWMVRLDLYDGTLLGGPVLLEHRLVGFDALDPQFAALRQLCALALRGTLPPSLRPRERRAPRWVLELRTADAIRAGATQQEMARNFFGAAVTSAHWRSENDSYRLRVRRLVHAAKAHLRNPVGGPWFR